MSKTIIAVRHFGLGGRESLETAVIIITRTIIIEVVTDGLCETSWRTCWRYKKKSY